MKIKFKCAICREKKKKPGALLFSPPNKKNKCKKLHICRACYKDFICDWMFYDLIE